jgi:Mg2+-importing ATPase
MGPLSSMFDLIVFALMWFLLGLRDSAIFQTVWFSYSIVSNLIGMHIIRTAKVPFLESNANKAVYASSIGLSIIGILVPFTFLGKMIGLVPIAPQYIAIILIVPILYCIVALFAKKIYKRKFGEWI